MNRVRRAAKKMGLKINGVFSNPKNKNNLAWNILGIWFLVIKADKSYLTTYHEVGHVFFWQKMGVLFSKEEFFSVFPKNGIVERILRKELPQRGFITEYAKTSHHEDFAEIFARVCMELFEGRKYKIQDKVVRRKYSAVKRWVKDAMNQ